MGSHDQELLNTCPLRCLYDVGERKDYAMSLMGLSDIKDCAYITDSDLDSRCDAAVAQMKKEDAAKHAELSETAYKSFSTKLKRHVQFIRDHSSYTSVPWHLMCPISLDLLQEPRVLSSGMTYSKQSIEAWINRGFTTDPLTREEISLEHLHPCSLIQAQIAEFKQSPQTVSVPRRSTPSKAAGIAHRSDAQTSAEPKHTPSKQAAIAEETHDLKHDPRASCASGQDVPAVPHVAERNNSAHFFCDVPVKHNAGDVSMQVVLVERLDERSLVSFDCGLQVYAPHTQHVNIDMFDVELLRSRPDSAISECFWIRPSESVVFPIRLRLPLLAQSFSQLAAPYHVCRIDDADIVPCEGGHRCSENATIEVVHEHVWRSKESPSKEYVEVKVAHLCAIFVRLANLNDSVLEKPRDVSVVAVKNETKRNGMLLIQNAANSVSSSVQAGVSQTNVSHERSSQPCGGLSQVKQYPVKIGETLRLVLQEAGPLVAHDPICMFVVLHQKEWRTVSTIDLTSSQVGEIVIGPVEEEVLDALRPTPPW
ncbi:hypothetical protein AB1Y20_008578 [Prymnesium parvum]|uniref:U-box domain-containing protein n=1 Tax=Prymnesium parvum TaxID=97485 RepID=A0AB34ITH1_PRYPA